MPENELFWILLSNTIYKEEEKLKAIENSMIFIHNDRYLKKNELFIVVSKENISTIVLSKEDKIS